MGNPYLCIAFRGALENMEPHLDLKKDGEEQVTSSLTPLRLSVISALFMFPSFPYNLHGV